MGLYFLADGCRSGRHLSCPESKRSQLRWWQGNRSAACEIDPRPSYKRRLPLPKHIDNHILRRRSAVDRNERVHGKQTLVKSCNDGDKKETQTSVSRVSLSSRFDFTITAASVHLWLLLLKIQYTLIPLMVQQQTQFHW